MPEFHPIADIFPMMSEKEIEDLAVDIEKNGLQNPIILYEEKILDGRNRFKACELKNIKPVYSQYKSSSPISFIISQNLKRRHLTKSQAMTVGVKALPMLEEEAKKRKVELGREAALKQHGRVGKKIYQPFHSEAEGRAREHAARLVGVSPQYIAQGKMIQKKGPELFEQIEQGKISISQAMSLLRRNEEKKQREKQMINTDIDLRKGDFKKVLANLGEIDVIITDPPYAKKYLILFSELGAFAQAKLKLDGFLAVYSGQYHLPEVIGCLSEHLTYVWTFCLYHKGEKQLVNGVNIMCGWKPILIFSKGRRKMRFSAYDVIVSEKAEKFSHRWQQSESGAKTLVEILSLPDELVVDPFAGTGTILKAASELGRRGIGATL